MKKYEILYRDEDLCVIHKRAGLAVQSARTSVPDLMSMLRNDLLEEGIKNPYLGLVNRLDQPVEGILLVAFNEKAAADLSRQVADHIHMEKWYQALVCGKPSAESGHTGGLSSERCQKQLIQSGAGRDQRKQAE